MLLTVALIVASAAGCGDDSSNASGQGGEKVKIAQVFSAQLSGSTYARSHYNALKRAIDDVGANRFDFTPVFGVPSTQQATQTYEQLFQQGTDAIVDTKVSGPLFFDACKEFEDKKCIGYVAYFDDGLQYAPNIVAANVDQALMYYPLGVAAGLLTKSGTLGFVGTFKAPFQIAITNAFALGCQSVRPDCKVRNIYIDATLDPPKEVAAVETLVAAGADVIGHFIDDPSVIQTAEKLGIKSFGLYRDDAAKAPNAWITGVLYEDAQTKVYTQILRSIVGDTWKPGGIAWGTESPPDLDLAPWGKSVPADVKAKVEQVLKDIENGKNPLGGPIRDTSGKVRIPAGESIPMRGVLINQWNWPVEGVIGG